MWWVRSRRRLASQPSMRCGIAYERRRALGTPPDLRVLFRAGRLAEATEGCRRHVRGADLAVIDL